MQVSKAFKYAPAQFESKEFFVALSHEELGLETPRDFVSVRGIADEMSRALEALLVIEKVKLGLVHPDQVAAELKPWLIPRSSSEQS